MKNEFIANPEEARELAPRYRILFAFLIFSFTVFSLRLWYLQLIQGEELRQFSDRNRIKKLKIQAPRGLILDRDGKILVENHPGFEAVLSPQYITNLQDLALNISPIIGIEPEKIIQRIERSRRQNGPFAQVKIRENLNQDEVFRLKRIRLDNPGLDVRESVVRYYPLTENGAQLFGYVSEVSKTQLQRLNSKDSNFNYEQGDIVGINGLEQFLEKDLRGTPGYIYTQVDAFGREMASTSAPLSADEIQDLNPIPGENAVLTIDRDVQAASYKAFVDNQRVGSLVAMKTNGEIISWVSAPSFNPNDFSKGIPPALWNKLINDPFKPLRNKALQDHFSPGSTFKPFVALAALEEKIITPTTIVSSPGVFMFARRPYHDTKKEGHGNINVYQALEVSGNVFFYKMGIELKIDKMFNYISKLGVGQRTGVDVPREVLGRMPNSEWKKASIGEEWQPGENLSVAVGQGFVEASPLQMLVGYNAIATSGKVVKPFVIKKIVDNEGRVLRETTPTTVRNLQMVQDNGVKISAETFKVVQDALFRVVQGERGTARRIRIPGVNIAGKTGTAQVMGFSADQIYFKCENRPINQRHHGWFVGWAPAENPEITVVGLAEHSCHGSSGAGPLVKETIRAYFEKYHPEMLEKGLAMKKMALVKPDEPVAPPVEGE